MDKSFGIYSFSGVVISLIFGLVFSVISLILPIFIIVFYPKRTDEWTTKVFNKKYGTVLAGLDRDPDPVRKGYDKRWALFYQMLLLLRRLLFVIAVIGAPNFLVLHFLLLFASSTASIIFLLSLWPTIKPRDTKLQVFNEICSYLLLYHLMCFSDFLPDAKVRYNLGYSYVFVAATNLIFYLGLMIR